MTRIILIFLLIIPLGLLANPYPINIINGLVVSNATIDGKDVVIVFDTGAPGLVLNSQFYSTDAKSKVECSGVNGNFECPTYNVKDWSWMGIHHKKTAALLSDLSFLETILHKKVHALVGLSALNNYFVSINFDQNSISLSEKMKIDKHETIRFQYADHIPVITCRVNGEKKHLGIDTGSEVNYLFRNDQHTETNSISDAIPVNIISPDNFGSRNYSRSMNLTLDGDVYYPSSFIMHSENENSSIGESFDGLLGQPFLTQFNITINPSKQILILSPRSLNGAASESMTAQL